MLCKEVSDFKRHEGAFISIHSDVYKFRIDGDNSGTFGFWDGRDYTLMTAFGVDNCNNNGFSIEIHDTDGACLDQYYDIDVNIDGFDDYCKLVEVLGRNLVDKCDMVGSPKFTTAAELIAYHKKVCDGKLEAAPALLTYNCDKCGSIAVDDVLKVSRFLDARKHIGNILLK